MRPAVLIAGNFMRENRWAIVLLLFWGFASGIAAALSVKSSVEDSLFFLKQQAVYSVFFTVFLAASALYNQRRSRRILAVLAKGIERHEYLAGIVLGFFTISLLYSFGLAVTGGWAFSVAGVNPFSIVPLVFMLLVASMLAGTVALFFSTFMTPLFTLLSTSIVIGLSAVLGREVPALVPAYTLMQSVTEMTYHSGGPLPWASAAWAVLETIGFWALASVVFSRRDIAVSVE